MSDVLGGYLFLHSSIYRNRTILQIVINKRYMELKLIPKEKQRKKDGKNVP